MQVCRARRPIDRRAHRRPAAEGPGFDLSRLFELCIPIMAKRLHMTSVDYLAIAISPALIMALVGSLVFFLIEVLYVGDWVGRLNYAFGLFVFATVLIGRISIEMGAE